MNCRRQQAIEDGIYDLIVEATVAERTQWSLTTVYRLVSDIPGVELKMTLTNSALELPLKEGDAVVIGVSCEGNEDEDPLPIPPGGSQ